MKTKIKKNWSKIEEIEQKVREKTGDPDAGFNASTFWIDGSGRHLMIPCMYRSKNRKKDGFSKTYKEMMVYAEYCPFTGKPLYESEDK